MKRLIFALSLLTALLTPLVAFGAPPPPVPALPDTERRTSYSITGTTCACAVNFALYGDGTDYQTWVEVFINGARVNFNDGVNGWTITSPSGTLGTLARPITDAVLTFNNPQTGTIQIVGARRARRTTQFNESRGVAARDLNQALTDIVAVQRENWDKINDVTGRGLFSQPGNTLGLLPLPAACASMVLGFDATGLNPVCIAGGGGGGGGTITINGVACNVGGSCTITVAVTSGTTAIAGGTSNTVLYEDSGGHLNNITNLNSAVLVTSAGGVPSLSTSLPSGLTVPSPALTGSPSGAGSIITVNSTACALGGSCTVTGPIVIGATSISGSTVNGVLYATAGNLLANTGAGNNGTLITSAGGVPSISSTLPAAVQANITGTGTLTSGATGAGFTLALATSTLTGAIPLANGGTNNTGLTPSAGGIVWSDATKLQILAGTSTPGQCLLSGNLVTPSWGSCSGAAAVSSVTATNTTLTISPTTGAVLAALNLGNANTWTAAQTFTDGDLLLKGATSGTLTLHSAAIAGTDSITFPHVTDTVAVIGTAQTFTAAQTFPTSGLILGGSSTGVTFFASANAGASNFTLTFPAVTANVGVLTGVNQTWTATNNFTGTFQIAGSAMTFPGSAATLAGLGIAQSWTAAQRGTPVNIAISVATFTPNFNTAQNFEIDLTSACPCTLANQSTTLVAGQSGMIEVHQDGTGSRTIGTWGSNYQFAGGTSTITLSTAANAIDYIPYYVNNAATAIILGALTKNPAH